MGKLAAAPINRRTPVPEFPQMTISAGSMKCPVALHGVQRGRLRGG